MFKIRSIAARLVLAISLTVAMACVILGTFSMLQQRALMRLALEQQLKLQYDSEGRTAMAVSSAIAALTSVADAVTKRDRDGLYAMLADATKALKAQGVPLVNLILPPATMFLRVQDPTVFDDDLSSRRLTVTEANKTGKPIVGVEQGHDTLANFAITPILRDGKSIAVVDIGAPFGKEFVDRAKQRFGVDLAVHSLEGGTFKTLSSTFGDRVVAT